MAKSIELAWQQAKERLELLRKEVLRTSQMAQGSARSKQLGRDRDVALRNLGEAVWRAVGSGQLQLPESMKLQQEALRLAESRLAAQSANVRALIAEGEAAIDQRDANKKTLNPVAPQGKKR